MWGQGNLPIPGPESPVPARPLAPEAASQLGSASRPLAVDFHARGLHLGAPLLAGPSMLNTASRIRRPRRRRTSSDRTGTASGIR